jgi:hypothetical protein
MEKREELETREPPRFTTTQFIIHVLLFKLLQKLITNK